MNTLYTETNIHTHRVSYHLYIFLSFQDHFYLYISIPCKHCDPTNTEMKTKMVHDTIPHYLRAGNCNNSANTNKDEVSTPTLQVNPKSRTIRSVSSGNLAKKTSFKSFESIQHSCKRSHTNSCKSSSNDEINDGNPGSSKDPNFTSNSNELLEQFNKKTNEIIKTMASLHFSTIDLRNKLSQGCINNNLPITTQVTSGNVSQQEQG